ncbi:hypothetical protein D3C72_2061850 [compost metagenome]
MARAVGHIGDLITIGLCFWHHLIEQIADGVYHLKVLLLVVPTDVVGLTHYPRGDHCIQCTGMVFHIEPVTDLVALAIDRQRLAIQGIEDHQRDQLLGEVAWAVVIGAVGDNGR